ncbi:hypothetical protein [Sphingomonas sp. GB1N7]|uniref:hypothetical protein n=1 Tax=Parasphingomonas caseinilytica TaxID=3096158 RepID=UPI002FCACED9
MHEAMRARFRAAVLSVILATSLCPSADASAQKYSARDVGGWTVAASKDNMGCFLTREYDRPGATTLLLGLDIDGSNHLSVLNRNWSIRPKDRLELDFRLSKGAYSKHSAVGMASDGKKGFVTNFETKFPSFFAKSEFLDIYRDDVPVEKLNLNGSGAAVTELRRCVEIQRTNPGTEAGPVERADDIPIDPFAPAPKPRSKD